MVAGSLRDKGIKLKAFRRPKACSEVRGSLSSHVLCLMAQPDDKHPVPLSQTIKLVCWS